MNKKTLSNGLRLITVPLKNTKVTTVLVLVKTGSKYEEKNVSGISHFLEHMFFKGTKKRKTQIKVAEDMDKLGGMYNAFTGEDYTGYYAKVNSSHLSAAVDWVSDIYLNSLLPEKEIEKEKGVIKEEINMYYDNPMIYCQILFQQLLYGDQPAGRDIAGTKKSVSSMNREKLLDYMNSQYTAENTVVVVAGDVKKREVDEKVGGIFSKMKSGKAKEKEEVVEEQSEPGVKIYYKETDQTHLCLGARAFNIFHSQRYTQEVVAALLGGMMSSRLFVKIRDELGLAYYIKTSAEDNPDTGVLVTQAGVDNKKAKDAVSAIMKEYQKIKKEKISPKELKKAKENLKGKAAILLESSDSLARFYGMSELLEKKTYSVEDIFRRVDKVKTKDVQDVAKQIFRPENINLAIVGPHKTEKPFKKIINI